MSTVVVTSAATSAATPAAAGPAPRTGRLVLVPNALDFGAEPQPLDAILPSAVLHAAAQLSHWLVEDAKSARAFLKRVHGLSPLREPLQSLQITELPRPTKGPRPADAASDSRALALLLAPLLAPAHAGHDVGLLSEAGLPAVADPGAAVVALAHAQGIEVQVLPGPSSLLLALAASGLDGQSFAFVGYLPQDATARRERIRELEATSRRLRQTQIFIETPYRNAALLAAWLDAGAATTRLSVSIGLTLPEGWTRTAPIGDWRVRPPALSPRLPAVFLIQA